MAVQQLHTYCAMCVSHCGVMAREKVSGTIMGKLLTDMSGAAMIATVILGEAPGL
jgi:hypothetical protein